MLKNSPGSRMEIFLYPVKLMNLKLGMLLVSVVVVSFNFSRHSLKLKLLMILEHQETL